MEPTTVHQFRRIDPATGRIIISCFKMTAEAIRAIGGEVIADTKQVVRSAALDDEGRYLGGAF